MTNNVKISGDTQDPIWECKIDGNTIPLKNPFQYTENNWTLCEWSSDQVSAGKHTLTVTSKSSGRALLFDYIVYTPTAGLGISNAFIKIPENDSAIQYGSGWQSITGLGRIAADGGSTAIVSFYGTCFVFPMFTLFLTIVKTGTGVTWMSTQPKELPQEDSTAEYNIDDQSPTTFIIKKPGGTTQYFQSYFQVTGLPLGNHKLTVTSKGKTSQTPLVLTSIIAQGSSTNPPLSGGTADSGTGVGSGTGGTGSTGGDSGNSSGGNSGNSSGSGTTVVTKPATTIISVDSNGSKTTIVTSPASTITLSPGNSGNVGNNGNTSSSGTSNGNNAGSNSSNNSGQAVSNNDTSVNNETSTDKKDGAPVGAIVGGIVGAIAIIALILAFLFFRRRRQKKHQQLDYSQPVQPFYQDTVSPHPTHATYATSESTQSGSHGMHQVSYAHAGHSLGIIPPTKGGMASIPPHAQHGHNPNALSFSSSSNPYPNPHDGSVAGYSTSTPSEVSAPSIAGSGLGTPLLHPNRAKYQEAFGMTPEAGPSHSRPGIVAVTHEDSGIRLPQPTPADVVEFPPVYTPS